MGTYLTLKLVDHPDLFEELPSDYEMEILQDAAKGNHKAHFIKSSFASKWDAIQEVRSFLYDAMEK